MKLARRGYLLWPLMAMLARSALAAAPPKPFTIEQVMSAPFPSDLVAAPTGGMVAWVFDACGVRNIWVAAPPDYRARALTSYTEDDGQEIAELAWTRDAQAIVYTRGGDFETMREAPNPRSFTQGAEQDIWLVTLPGYPLRKLAEGHSPAVSPKGDEVAYVYKDQVWLAMLSGTDKPAQLIHAKGKAETLRWSSDGSKLALVSTRDGHSFISVYDFTQKSIQYLDPSVDRDIEPAWSPDDKQIAYLRLPATSDQEAFGPKREGTPWSIRVADVETKVGHEVWRSCEGRGSVFHFLAANQQLFWTADDHLIFPWEGDGWTHLYSVPLKGGAATLMTPGDFEVENAALTPDRREVVFNSNQDDIDRRHLWREAANASKPMRATGGDGIEWSPVTTSDGQHVVMLRSDARWPARPALVGKDGSVRDIAPESIPRDFPATRLIAPQPVTLAAADGMKLHGQLFLPANAPAGERHPAVVFFHGGSRRQMLLGWHYMQYYHNAYALNQYLASPAPCTSLNSLAPVAP